MNGRRVTSSWSAGVVMPNASSEYRRSIFGFEFSVSAVVPTGSKWYAGYLFTSEADLAWAMLSFPATLPIEVSMATACCRVFVVSVETEELQPAGVTILELITVDDDVTANAAM